MQERAVMQDAKGLGHDIRTHLNILLGAVNIMECGRMTEEQIREYAAMIRHNVLAMLRMVNRLLVENKMEAVLVDARIDAQLLGIISCVESFAHERQVELVSDVEAQIYARCDPEMLERVLYNLLSNAIKSTDPGGVVYLSARMGEGQVRINVADTGCGFTKEQLAMVLSDEDEGVGSGCGLRVVKALMRLMHGSMECTSHENVGTTFYLYLPAARDALLRAR